MSRALPDGGWPKVSVVIGGSPTDPATLHTAASVRAGDYGGEIQVLTGSVDETGTPAAVADAHVAESSGPLLMFLPPGTTLDPRCLRRLVSRMQDDEDLAAVAPEWRGPDGIALESVGYLSADEGVRPVLQGGRHPASVIPAPHGIELDATGWMLVRTRHFFTAGGYDLDLDGSPYLGADLGRRLTRLGGSIQVERRAVAFAPLRPDLPRRLPGYPLVRPPAEPAPAPAASASPRSILWAAAHIPDRRRSGVDARHLEMIEALVDGGAEVTVWAEHDTGGRDAAADFHHLGVRWLAPPPDRRWDPRLPPRKGRWLRDLLGSRPWEAAIIAEPRLAGWIIPQVRAVAPPTRTIVDFGTVRFPAAHLAGEPSTTVGREMDPYGSDGVITATGQDRTVMGRMDPGLPAFVFSALGTAGGPGPGPASGGGPLFVGDLFHRPNLEALEWWVDAVAARVEGRTGRPTPLRVVGHGSEAHGATWNHPGKIRVAGWKPDLQVELAAARMLIVPMTFATGTGGRISTALRYGLPVVASAAAAAVLPAELAGLVLVGTDADGVAGHVARLMTDDGFWEETRERIAAADIDSLHRARTAGLGEWIASLEPAVADSTRPLVGDGVS